jgi:hypothetical protein
VTPRLHAFLRYIAPDVPTSTHLRIVAAKADFDAFAYLGHPISDVSVWRKGHEFMYPDGLTEAEWHRETRRIWLRARPLWAVLGGYLVAGYVLAKAVRP